MKRVFIAWQSFDGTQTTLTMGEDQPTLTNGELQPDCEGDALAHRSRLLGGGQGHTEHQARLEAVHACRRSEPVPKLRRLALRRGQRTMLEL